VPVFHAEDHSSRSAERLVRRLKRDRPDIAEALARGEYKSASGAGIAASERLTGGSRAVNSHRLAAALHERPAPGPGGGHGSGTHAMGGTTIALIAAALLAVAGACWWLRRRPPGPEPEYRFRCPGCRNRLRFRC
jgi:hypothetical protein